MKYNQASTDIEIESWVKDIIFSERNVVLSKKQIFKLLNEKGLIHQARIWGEGDTDIGDQILSQFDKVQKKENVK